MNWKTGKTYNEKEMQSQIIDEVRSIAKAINGKEEGEGQKLLKSNTKLNHSNLDSLPTNSCSRKIRPNDNKMTERLAPCKISCTTQGRQGLG